MLKGKKIACIIPARLKSTRFPEKMLSNLAGKPLLQWVWDAANKTTMFCDIAFAIDDEKIAKVIKSFNGKYVMTSINCKSGTDRLVEIVHKDIISADIYVNWQGDEPFITPKMIHTLLQSCDKNDADIWTLKKQIISENEILSPNFAKIVSDSNNYALYFSRSPIPYYRDKTKFNNKTYYKHVGIYAYTREALQKIGHMNHDCYLENAEKLEQLRFLYNGLKIKLHITDQEVIGIDTPEDLQKAEERIKKFNLI